MAQMREVLHLNDSMPVKYLSWLKRSLTGDFGNSLNYRKPAIEVVQVLIWRTFMLNLAAMFFTVIISIPMGVRAAAKKMDYSINSFQR